MATETTTPTYGEMLQTLRKLRGLSQPEFAERVGVSQTLVSLYESGKRQITYAMGERFAAILDVHPTLFMDTQVWEDYRAVLRQADNLLLSHIQKGGGGLAHQTVTNGPQPEDSVNGEVAERLKASVSKTGVGDTTVGSNPTLSADGIHDEESHSQVYRGTPVPNSGRQLAMPTVALQALRERVAVPA